MEDKLTEPRRRQQSALFVILLVVVGASMYFTYELSVRSYGPPKGPGEFGDLFGVANTVFSGLALIGVVYAVLLQSRELRLQVKELAETTDELRKQTQLESILRILEYVHAPELRRVRFFMFRKDAELRALIASVAKDGRWNDLDREVNDLFRDPSLGGGIEWQQIEVTLKMTDEVAHLINDGHAPYNPLATKLIANEFLRWWNMFEPYVWHRRGNGVRL